MKALLVSPSKVIPSLTGIRAIAAGLVFIHHFNPVAAENNRWLHHLLNEMHIGVSIFFVLSGFLITLRYEDAILKKHRWRPYLQNRVARILPLYLLLTSATFLYFYFSTKSFDLRTYLFNVTLLKGFFSDLKFTGIAQAWSLTVEECFYVLAPVIFLIAKRVHLFIQPVVILCVSIFLVALQNNFQLDALFDRSAFLLTYTFAGRCVEFYTGIYLAYLYKNRVVANSVPFTFLGLTAMLLCLAAMAIASDGNSVSVDVPAGLALNNLVLPVCIACFFYGLITEKTWVNHILSTNLFQILGKSSYAFYLVHVGFVQILLCQWVSCHPMVLYLILNAISYALFRLVEQPMQQLVKSK